MCEIISFEDMVHFADGIRSATHPIVLTSGGMDPVHVGHTRLLIESAKIAGRAGFLFVLINDDDFLLKKKGKVFMPLVERMEVVAAVRGVDYVAPWSHPTQFVDQAILALRPTYFTKGGDRSSPAQMAQQELDACLQVGCEILYGVGGSDKVQSSSWLTRKYNENAGQET